MQVLTIGCEKAVAQCWHAKTPLLQVSGEAEDAVALWRRCAKTGDIEAQLRLGIFMYEGTNGE